MGALARIRGWQLVVLLLLWTLLVLYPNPYRLLVSVLRVASPPIDPAAVAHLVPAVPHDPQLLERYVLSEFPYQYDWQTYGVPWYFPTVGEALERGTGDCKTRFVVFASLLEALEIPYRQTMSLTHYWVHYEGKVDRGIERQEYAFLIRDEEGTTFQLPQEELDQIWDIFREAFWDHMPVTRRVLLLAGPVLTSLLALGARRARRDLRALAAAG